MYVTHIRRCEPLETPTCLSALGSAVKTLLEEIVNMSNIKAAVVIANDSQSVFVMD